MGLVSTAVGSGNHSLDDHMDRGIHALPGMVAGSWEDDSQRAGCPIRVCGLVIRAGRGGASIGDGYHQVQEMILMRPLDKLFGRRSRAGSTTGQKWDTVQFRRTEIHPNGASRYEVHTAPSRSDALAFLREQEVREEGHYVIVETPEGNVGRDLIMIFDEGSGEMIELGERKPLPKLRRSMTRCARCGYTVLPAGQPLLSGGLTTGSVVELIILSDLQNRGVGFHCSKCRTLWCPFCVSLEGEAVPCGICGRAMDLFRE